MYRSGASGRSGSTSKRECVKPPRAGRGTRPWSSSCAGRRSIRGRRSRGAATSGRDPRRSRPGSRATCIGVACARSSLTSAPATERRGGSALAPGWSRRRGRRGRRRAETRPEPTSGQSYVLNDLTLIFMSEKVAWDASLPPGRCRTTHKVGCTPIKPDSWLAFQIS